MSNNKSENFLYNINMVWIFFFLFIYFFSLFVITKCLIFSGDCEIYAYQDILSTTSAAVDGPEPAETDYDDQGEEYDDYSDQNGNLAEQ